METKFIPFQPQPMTLSRSLYLNLINEKDFVLNDIRELHQQFGAVLNGKETIPFSQQPKPISRATNQAIQERFAEIKGQTVSFKTTQLAKDYTDNEIVLALEGLAQQIESAGVKFIKPGLIVIDAICTLHYDSQGQIISTEPDLGLNGYHALEMIAGICAQDFGLVIERNNALIYLYGSARYEKTPKNIHNGFDHFLGEDFLEWHRRILGVGPILANLFHSMYQLFKKNQFDQLIVDLTGRNLYTNGQYIIKRYERDYVLPLLTANGKVAGMTVFADSLFKDINDKVCPLFDGKFLQISSPLQFHDCFTIMTSENFQPHPIGMRDKNA